MSSQPASSVPAGTKNKHARRLLETQKDTKGARHFFSAIVYRGENFGQGSGRFFGLTKPANSLDAEIMYNLNKWGNNATQLGEYVIPAGTRGFIGGVEGGTGIQIFLPNASGVQLMERSTLFTSELKFITH